MGVDNKLIFNLDPIYQVYIIRSEYSINKYVLLVSIAQVGFVELWIAPLFIDTGFEWNT